MNSMSHSTKFAIHRWFLMQTTCICQHCFVYLKRKFNVGYAFETIELIEEEHNQFAELENEIEDLTDTIHLLRKVEKISFNMVFVCSILLVVMILFGAVAYVLTVKAGAR